MIGSPLKSVMSQVLQNVVPGFGFDRHRQHFGFAGVEVAPRQVVGERPAVGGAFSGSHPLFAQRLGGVGGDRRSSGPSSAVRGSGGRADPSSGGPIHTCTPWMRPSDICTTSVRITRSCFGVMLLRPTPARTVSPMAVWIAIRCGFRLKNALIGTRFLVRGPCATTAGSLPSVSTSSQSWVMAASYRRADGRLPSEAAYGIRRSALLATASEAAR